MTFPLYGVDAFAQKPFEGNPAGVCLLENELPAEQMQKIAAEMNLSETAFIIKKKQGLYSLRWFSPLVEVDLCGHATLASAFVMFSEGLIPKSETIVFDTRSGILKTSWDNGQIAMEFPYENEKPAAIPQNLEKALGTKPVYVGQNRMDYLVQLESEEIVRNLKPDLELLKQIPTRGFMVTAKSQSSNYDFVSRVFGPRVGINEDPVTGSAHCCLGPFWSEKLGKKKLMGYQASARGGYVAVELLSDVVKLSGPAVIVFKGNALI